MGKSIKLGWILLVATLFFSLPAFADDLLVMPYSCTIVDGRPQLTPAPNQSHRIIGAREQRSLRTCSPINPALCRQWTIHRFDVDCEGMALPWASVIANAQPQRAWLENGRLHIRMPPSWTMAPDDPCSAEPGRGEPWRYGRLQRYCADRRALTPPAVVEMPAGFAPLLGIDAIFVTPPPAKNVAPQATHSPQAPMVAAAPFPPNITRTEPVQPGAPKEPLREPPPAKPPVANAEAVALAPAPAPVIPKIINRPDVATETTASPPVTVVETETAAVETSVLAVNPEAPMPASSALAFARWAVLALAAVLLAFAAVALTQARARRHQPAASRALAPRWGENEPPRKVVPARRGATEGLAIWSTTTATSPTWNEEVPRTRSDALHVLGMGVTADANVVAIKKIVDGLRQTWHPDLARDPSDREVRERRMKQINVAWDILAAKPAQT